MNYSELLKLNFMHSLGFMLRPYFVLFLHSHTHTLHTERLPKVLKNGHKNSSMHIRHTWHLCSWSLWMSSWDGLLTIKKAGRMFQSLRTSVNSCWYKCRALYKIETCQKLKTNSWWMTNLWWISIYPSCLFSSFDEDRKLSMLTGLQLVKLKKKRVFGAISWKSGISSITP